MQPIITIKSYEAGMVDDITTPASNGFAFSNGMDIYTNPGFLSVSRQMVAMGTTLFTDSGFNWQVQYGSSGSIYAIDSKGSIWIYNFNSGNTWNVVHRDSIAGKGQGLTVFNGNLYWVNNTSIGKYNGTTWTDSYGSLINQNGLWNPMVILGTILYIADTNTIDTLDTSGVFKNNVSGGSTIAIPSEEQIRCMTVYNNNIYFGITKNAVSQTDGGEFNCRFYSWDGFSPSPTSNPIIREQGIWNMITNETYLYFFAGMGGNIYEYNGATFDKVKTVYGIYEGGSAFVLPGASTFYKGNIIFGLSNPTTSNNDYGGIFTLGKRERTEPLSLVGSYIPANGTIRSQTYYSLFPTQVNGTEVFFSSYNQKLSGSVSGGTAIDRLNDSINPIGTGAFMESQIYSVNNGDQTRSIKGIEITAKTLNAGDYITVSTKLDYASAWSAFGSITSTNQNVPLFGQINPCKKFQFRLDFNLGGLIPQIDEIKVY